MRPDERNITPSRPIEIAIHTEYGPAATPGDLYWTDRPAHLVVWLSGIRTEVEYTRGSIAHAAAMRIAKAHMLVRMPTRARWRSRPPGSRWQGRP